MSLDVRMISGLALACLLMLAPSAFAQDSGAQDAEAQDAASNDLQGNQRMELAKNEGFQSAFPKPGNPTPEYPPELLEKQEGPIYVCFNVDVSETGETRDALPSWGSKGCPAREEAPDARYIYSAMNALRQWRFEPAFRCVFPKREKPHPQCRGFYKDEIPTAVRLAFRVVFDNSAGQAEVRIER